MLSKEAIKDYIEKIAKHEGLDVYDIDMPTSSGVLRVYLFSKDKPVSIEDCALVSRRISNLPECDDILPGKTRLEVSSAGINRALKTKEHFMLSVGERIKVRLCEMFENKKNILGKLEKVEDEGIIVLDEDLKKQVDVKFSNIDRARVDFDFDKKSKK